MMETMTTLLRKSLLILMLLFSGLSLNAAAQEYRLGDGDNIRIVVFQNPELTLETRVSEDGSITFPLIGTVKIGGLTISAAAQTIATSLKGGGFIQQPQVNIFLLKNLGNQVSVLGQVGRPGRYPLETFNTRLSEMMAMAGGIAPTGSDIVIIDGIRDGTPFRKEVDIANIFLTGNRKDDVLVSGGDVIFVQRQPMFYIYGEVQRPGSFRVERAMTIRQALALSGGLSIRGTERNFGVYRSDGKGQMSRNNVDLDDLVKPNDVFHVREALF